MEKKLLADLLRLHFSGQLTDSQREKLSELVRIADEQELKDLLSGLWQDFATVEKMEEETAERIYASLVQAIEKEEDKYTPVHPREEPRDRRVHFLRRFRWAAAAVFIIAVVTFFLVRPGEKTLSPIVYRGNVFPGKLGSKIKLSDGRVVMIDTVKEGLVATENGWKILKKGGNIIYEKAGESGTGQTQYNEVFAERGHESEAVQLPDGSVAWLNAGSSLKFPLSFTGATREVNMTGEIYFEVRHNERQPFRVRTGTETIEDIGTSFNVNAYPDEPAMVTTLVEGSIRIKDQLLRPGQAYSNGSVYRTDVDKAIAWHKGLFSFSQSDIPSVMRQLSRWYNVEVRYEGEIPRETFSGKMERSLTLADALDYIKQMHVHFRIEEDRRIVISDK